MTNFKYRTEGIRKDQLFNFFVETEVERGIINDFKSDSHVVLEGSRGSGKSFIMKIAENELNESFNEDKILPIYITFVSSSLIYTNDKNQFFNWMIAKVLKETLKVFQKKGLTISKYAHTLIKKVEENKLEEIINLFENSYRSTNSEINTSNLPEISDIIDVIESVCDDNNVYRIVYFFDEAAHVFRPEHQRQFFTLFRDFKSPHISCNAAVYPGVTHYGNSFEMTHDSLHRFMERSITSSTFLFDMKSMVIKQGGETWKRKIENQMENFNTLAYCSGGNPRIFLKTLDNIESLNGNKVNDFIRNFYRSEIWVEHSQLGEKFNGLKKIIDWGRRFIEDHIIPATFAKNKISMDRKTIFFWISKDAPEIINEALRLLSYTGIIRKVDSGVKATKSKIGSRYEIKYGCILAKYKSPTKVSKDIIPNLKLEFVTEYGQNNSLYTSLSEENILNLTDQEYLATLNEQLSKSITVLDLTPWQKAKLESIEINTIQELLDVTEQKLQTIPQVGVVRSRIMKNSAVSELLETISG